jgi:hypothetical protein
MQVLKFDPNTSDMAIMEELRRKNLYCIRFKYGYSRRMHDLKAKLVYVVPESWKKW